MNLYKTLPQLNVVLKSPIIPWNTGNAGRTCLGFGAALHLVKPLGFDPSDKQAKRAGLDYWPHVNLFIHDDWDSFERDVLGPELNHNGFLFSKQDKHGQVPLHDVNFFPTLTPPPPPPPSTAKVALIFGSEQKGLDGISEHSLATLPRVYFPMNTSAIRSYNLSSSVAMGLSEAWRQTQHLPTHHRRQSFSTTSGWTPPLSLTQCQLKDLPPSLRHTFVPLCFDSSSDAMLQRQEKPSSVINTVVSFLQRMGSSMATTFGGFTHSDAAALFRTHHMFALSSSVAKALLYPTLTPSSSTNRMPKLLDVGAATGTTTAELSDLFQFVVATEASVVCARRLAHVVDVALTTNTLDEAAQYGPFDVVSLLNVLDRTEHPQQLLAEAIGLLKHTDNHQHGGLLLAFSQPLKPFVQPQTFATPNAIQRDNKMDGHTTFFDAINSKESFETFASGILEQILVPNDLEVIRWSKFPYVAGSHKRGYQCMPQAIFLVRPRETRK